MARVRVRLKVRVRIRAAILVARVRVGGTHFHKPTHSASTHYECTQITSLVVRLRVKVRIRLWIRAAILVAACRSFTVAVAFPTRIQTLM